MLIILEQVFTLFAFALAGYIVSKLRIVKAEHTQILSGLLVYVFSTCNVFNTFTKNFNVEYISARWHIILISTVVTIILAIAARFATKFMSKEQYEQQVFEYSLVVPNVSYMGYALCESLMGLAALLDMVVYALPINIYIYTRGYSMLTKRSMSMKKLLNAFTVSMLIGAAVGMSGIRVPTVLMNIVEKSNSCMAPVSMLLMGITISEFKLRDLVSDKRAYLVSILRLLVLPIAIGGVLSLFCPTAIVQVAVLLFAMPCGLNTIVFPKIVGERCDMGASLATISNVLACGTIPLVLTLFGIGA